MDLFEFQARELFEKHGVPVLPGVVVESVKGVSPACERLGIERAVVKAQVKTGGRGKAGGVKLAESASDAEAAVRQILGMRISGHEVRSVLVTTAVDIAAEFYFSIVLDRASRGYIALCSKEGGVEIEELARTKPKALAKVAINPARGIDESVAGQILAEAGFGALESAPLVPVIEKLWRVCRAEDATLVEVNPLVRTRGGEVIALDGKVSLDDNARFRHPEHEAFVDPNSDDPLEAEARALGLGYVKLGGNVGIIGNGAGLVMSTLDVVAFAGRESGARPANFLDIGGGASAEVMARGLGVILSDPQVESVFVNVFGGITACDLVAQGIVGALEELGAAATKPIVVRLDGNAVDEGRRILREAAHPLVTIADSMDDGAALAAKLAAGREA